MNVTRWNQLWRLFFLRTSRNIRTVDGIGFFHVMAPVIGALWAGRPEGREMAERHAGYFNTNPILASYVAGVVTNMERRRREGEDITGEGIELVKGTLSSVLTARGDYFFDVILVPLGLTIGCVCAMYGWYIGPVVFLSVYNCYHFRSRIGGYMQGVRLGEGIGRELVTRLFREQRLLGGCAAFASGAFTALAATRAGELAGMVDVAWGIAASAGMFVLVRRMSFVWSALIIVCATALFLFVR